MEENIFNCWNDPVFASVSFRTLKNCSEGEQIIYLQRIEKKFLFKKFFQDLAKIKFVGRGIISCFKSEHVLFVLIVFPPPLSLCVCVGCCFVFKQFHYHVQCQLLIRWPFFIRSGPPICTTWSLFVAAFIYFIPKWFLPFWRILKS